MKNRRVWFVVGVAVGLASIALLQRQRKRRIEVLAWQEVHRIDLDVLACPACQLHLAPQTQGLHCGHYQGLIRLWMASRALSSKKI